MSDQIQELALHTRAVLEEMREEFRTKFGWTALNFEVEEKRESANCVYVYITHGDKRTYMAQFSLTPMPGCPEVLISHGAEVATSYARRGIGTYLNEIRERIAIRAQASQLLCTVNAENFPQTHLLIKRKWRMLGEFYRRDRYPKVLLWMHVVHEKVY